MLAATVLVGCGKPQPHTFGQINDLAPKVAATPGERLPLHVTAQLARPANVAIFLVMPGRSTILLFPQDSLQSQYVEAGSHLLETSMAKATAKDSSSLIRRPGQGPVGTRPTNPNQSRSRNPRDTLPTFGFNQRGFLLMYASQQPLPYSTLMSKVAGLTVPIEDTDALNTVTKLVRERTGTSGPWAAYATDFPP
jgi:hypothetical protein